MNFHSLSHSDSDVGLDGDVHGAGAEGADEEPSEAAGAIDGEEFEVIAVGNAQIERLPIPGVVNAEAMAARGDGNCDGATVHEFSDGFAIELHDDLAELDIVRRGATDGDLRPGRLWRGGGHGRSKAYSQNSPLAKTPRWDRGDCATYFLNRSSKAWRASLWRGGGGVEAVVPFCAYEVGAVSFSTVVRNS